MSMTRRGFLRSLGAAATLPAAASAGTARAGQSPPPSDPYGVLVDLTRCIGCRKCEQACNEVNHLPAPDVPFDDARPLNAFRRPDADAFTVVNRFFTGRLDEKRKPAPTYVKVQCMHCSDPACASACITGALAKKENGAVHYDVSRCIGCRYCMVACPFQIPAYEYHDPVTPRVRKCTFCFDRVEKEGKLPGCVSICPVEALTFGKREAVLESARKRVKDNPGRYVDHVYGEKEVGGTSWMYVSGVAFEKVGLLPLPETAPPRLTESIQSGLFSYLWSPLALFGTLGGVMALTHRKRDRDNTTEDTDEP